MPTIEGLMHQIIGIKAFYLSCLLLVPGICISSGQNPKKLNRVEVFKNFRFVTDPPGAEIWVDGKLLGLSNNTFSIPAQQQSIIIIKSGYATEKFSVIVDENKPANEEIFRKLKKNYPFTILNEGKGKYNLDVKGIDSLSDVYFDNEKRVSGQENMLPYGRYRLKLKDKNHIVYRGRHIHSPNFKPVITLPVYSRGSFNTLLLDYADPDNMEASFGQSQFFLGSGLSTSFLNVQYLHTEVKRSTVVNPEYVDTLALLIPSIFLLNWDFRVGGSIFRYLDICALGRFKYSPGLKFLGVNINGFDDAAALTGFYGFELSSRLPYFNLNIKVGNQIIEGKSFVFDKNSGDYLNEEIPIRINWPIVSFGLVINGPIDRANNMLRLWKRPILFEISRKRSK